MSDHCGSQNNERGGGGIIIIPLCTSSNNNTGGGGAANAAYTLTQSHLLKSENSDFTHLTFDSQS